MNALLVGQRFFDDQTLAIQLRCWGFHCDFASNVTDARRILKSNQHDLVLSLALLPDGIGDELIKASETRPVTAFICLELDDICIWMAASDRGKEWMGKAALSTTEFTRMLEELPKKLAALSSARSPNRGLRIVPSTHHRPCGPRNRERSEQPSSSLALVEVISD
jgi:hypothetical protein